MLTALITVAVAAIAAAVWCISYVLFSPLPARPEVPSRPHTCQESWDARDRERARRAYRMGRGWEL